MRRAVMGMSGWEGKKWKLMNEEELLRHLNG